MALFTVWEDGIDGGQYIFPTRPGPQEKRKNPGRTELISVLDEVIRDGFAIYGIQCTAADLNAVRRKRKSFIDSHLLDMRVRREDEKYVGRIVGHIPAYVIRARGSQAAWIAHTGINDIDRDEVGNSDPEYRLRMAGSYVRDNRVRAQVLKRAQGVCEFQNCKSFKKLNGAPYLETHHVISLSEQGPDKTSNVIALCANHHREAHFGKEWQSLQDEFIKILKKMGN